MVRNEERGKIVASKYPSSRLVYADLSDSQTLEKEASKADIVIHCASIEDAVSSAALAKGLAKRSRDGPAFWICLSGTDNLAWRTVQDDSYGKSYDQVYDDFEHVSDVTSLPDDAPHRDVEKIQLAASSHNVRVAIVCAPCVYGAGSGCGNVRSIQVPDLAKTAIEQGYAFRVNDGLNRWPNVHVHDLSRLILAVLAEAASGGGRATWGADGYYFAENGEHRWGDIAEDVAKEIQKQTGKTTDTRSVSADKADEIVGFGALFFGSDSRCKGIRAKKLLGWQPQEHSIEAEVKWTCASELQRI